MPFAPHFDLTEAQSLIAFSAIFQGATPPLVLPPAPANWTPTFTSPTIGAFDNAWQLWSNAAANQYAVVIRGTISEAPSVIEDLMAVMIPATGSLPAGSVQFDYKLAEDPDAAVHLGFVLGLWVLLFDGTNGILTKLSGLPAGANVFIAGHSQGAAIATLCRSYLEYSPLSQAKGFSYKTYLFAQPKPGNNHYGWDFERIVSNPDLGFRVCNSQDWVHEVPLTIQLVGHLNQPNPLDLITKSLPFRLIEDGVDAFMNHLADAKLTKHIPQIQALEQILKGQNLVAVSPAKLPAIPIVPNLNFTNCGSAVSLPGTPGSNPQTPGDFMWQHHAAMYHQLLQAVFSP